MSTCHGPAKNTCVVCYVYCICVLWVIATSRTRRLEAAATSALAIMPAFADSGPVAFPRVLLLVLCSGIDGTVLYLVLV